MSKVTHGDIYGLWEEYYPNVDGFIKALMRQNVIIQRGENRHPYADVYHEILEGAEYQWKDPRLGWTWDGLGMDTRITHGIKRNTESNQKSLSMSGSGIESKMAKSIWKLKDFIHKKKRILGDKNIINLKKQNGSVNNEFAR